MDLKRAYDEVDGVLTRELSWAQRMADDLATEVFDISPCDAVNKAFLMGCAVIQRQPTMEILLEQLNQLKAKLEGVAAILKEAYTGVSEKAKPQVTATGSK